ncbi:MAG: hypothetical protein K8R59_01880, partial [Thermoanaerobaculales bacterium]|nr:hypothetical protein [Thermoanaerobaculales bacterium]
MWAAEVGPGFQHRPSGLSIVSDYADGALRRDVRICSVADYVELDLQVADFPKVDVAVLHIMWVHCSSSRAW